jgi:hypothetical protein
LTGIAEKLPLECQKSTARLVKYRGFGPAANSFLGRFRLARIHDCRLVVKCVFFFLWCAFVYSTRAQQVSSYPTSTSNGALIPWITYTSTRSCTSRPSTIFVYTSNSSSFLLTHYGLSSATTPAVSTLIPTVSGAHDAVGDLINLQCK